MLCAIRREGVKTRLVEYFGQMKAFADLKVGEFFAFFEDGATHFGMRIAGDRPEHAMLNVIEPTATAIGAISGRIEPLRPYFH